MTSKLRTGQSPLTAHHSPLTTVQPGGGLCMQIELAWGRLRRAWLRTFRPGYVKRMSERRQGQCPACPHDIIDPRDLKFYRNVCGYWFRPEDDSFRWRDRLRLARHGLCEVLVFTLLATLVLAALLTALCFGMPAWLFWPLTLALGLAWLQCALFFRDPERVVPNDPSVLVSPADGVIKDIVDVEEPDFPGGRALRIGIFLSIFNVHVNRSPRAGRVVAVHYFPGKFLDARHPEAGRLNEQTSIDLEDRLTSRPIRVKQISGAIARRIVCWLKPGDELQAGQRIGMIKFGSRTEVYVPVESGTEVLVKVGDEVKGGLTILLRFAGEPTTHPGP